MNRTTKIHKMRDPESGKEYLVRNEHVEFLKEYHKFELVEFVGELYEMPMTQDFSGYWQD